MNLLRRASLPCALAGAVLFTACGGGGPTSPQPVPSPSPVGGQTVQVVVYYDENQDGIAQPQEQARVPNVEVSIAGHAARSAAGTGQAAVEHVPDGSYPVAVRVDSLPPFYRVGAPVNVSVPVGDGSRVFVPLILPIGQNEPNVYMAFGDSITRGEQVTSDARYTELLAGKLGPHFATAEVSNRGADATNTFAALERIDRNLELGNPAYTLILYGTNDWNLGICQDNPSCDTVPNLRKVVDEVKNHSGLPVIATLPPTNPALTPEGRNQWTRDINGFIKTMAQQEGALLVDVNKAFTDKGGDLSRFYVDDVHPNRDGNAIIAEAFFEAIAFGRSSPQAAGARSLFFRP